MGCLGGGGDGIAEGADPVVNSAFSEVDQASDVLAGVGGQDDADRRHVHRGEVAATEDDVEQAAAGAAVAVAEGVDRLELGVGDGRLGGGGTVGEVDEG